MSSLPIGLGDLIRASAALPDQNPELLAAGLFYGFGSPEYNRVKARLNTAKAEVTKAPEASDQE